MVQPVVQPVVKPKDTFAGHFFRWLRWSAVMGALIPICIVAAVQWQTVKHAKYETELKREMLERGMTAEDIQKVLLASANPSRHRSVPSESNYYTARHAEIEAGLIKELASLNMSADDIERVYRAFNATTSPQAKTHSTSERAMKDAAFVKRLAQSGRSAAEIERLIKVNAKGATVEAKIEAAAEKSQQAKIEDALKTLLKSGLTADDLTRILKTGDGATAETVTP
jgi:DNA-binding transcriptional MerR regulator